MESKMVGYIKLWRSILHKNWYKNAACRDVFIHFLLTAAFENKDGEIPLNPGEAFYSVEGLARKYKHSNSTIKRAIKRLESDQVLTHRAAYGASVAKLHNWAVYQGSDNQSEPKSEPIPAPHTKKKEERRKKKEYIYSENFERFWQVYPRKVDKAKAAKIFDKIDHNEFDLIEKAKEYARYCEANGTESRYIKHPSTWLNQSCYLDDFVIEHSHNEISHEDIIAKVKAARANVI